MRDRLMIIAAILIAFVLFSPAAVAHSANDLMIVNHQYQLSSSYTPQQLVYLNSYIKTKTANARLRADAAQALGQMVKAMSSAGISDIRATNGYRDYKWQTDLYQNKIKYYRSLGYDYSGAQKLASAVVAPPGLSEHQTGLAVDLSTITLNNGLVDSFADTAAGKWVSANCYKYGFIVRYPENKTSVTGYIYEPWHIRYVGQPHAEYIYKNNLCLEEYLQLLAKQEVLVFSTEDGQLYAVYHSSCGYFQFNGQMVSRSRINDGYSVITTKLTITPYKRWQPYSVQDFLGLPADDQPVQNLLYFPMLIAANG